MAGSNMATGPLTVSVVHYDEGHHSEYRWANAFHVSDVRHNELR